MAKTRGALQKEFNAELEKEKILKEKIARYDREGIEVSKEKRQELSDLQKYTRDTRKTLIDMYDKGSDAAKDAKDAALEYAASVGDKLAKAAKKGGDAQDKVYGNTKGIWAELIKKRLQYEEMGGKEGDKGTAQIDKLLEVGEEFLSTSQMTSDQVENMKKTLGGIDMEGLGVSAEDSSNLSDIGGAGEQYRGTWKFYIATNQYRAETLSMTHMDSPATTSKIYYGFQSHVGGSGQTGRLNSSAGGVKTNSVSSITIYEVAG